jgi:hypothetical protein
MNAFSLLTIQSYSLSSRNFSNFCKSCLSCLNLPLGIFALVIILNCKNLQDLVLGGVPKLTRVL